VASYGGEAKPVGGETRSGGLQSSGVSGGRRKVGGTYLKF
jgi:hypothetical protein